MTAHIPRLITLVAACLTQAGLAHGSPSAGAAFCWSHKDQLIAIDPREFLENEWQIVIWNVDKSKYQAQSIEDDCSRKTLSLRDLQSQSGATVTLNAANDLTYSVDTAIVRPKAGHLSPVLLSKELAPKREIWREERQISASLKLAVPSYNAHGKAVGYVSLVMLFRDQTTKNPFWFSVQLWDPRGYGTARLKDWAANRRTFTMIDACVTCTSLPHILTAVGDPDDLATAVRQGAASAATFPASEISFDLSISKHQFAQAIDRIRAMPERKDRFTADPVNYTLDMIAIQLESWSGKDASVAWDATVTDLKVDFDESRGLPY